MPIPSQGNFGRSGSIGKVADSAIARRHRRRANDLAAHRNTKIAHCRSIPLGAAVIWVCS